MRFQQTDFWTYFKCEHGWEKISSEFGEKKQPINILYRNFKLGFFKAALAYIPMAPEFFGNFEKENEIKEYLSSISDFSNKIKAKLPKNTICIRYDFPLDFKTIEESRAAKQSINTISKRNKLKIKKNKVDIQPPDSVLLDLTQTEDDILANMKSKWRYNIRYAIKHNVKVRTVRFGDRFFDKNLDSFYELYKTTAQRDGIGIHPKQYYEDLLIRGSKSRNSSNLSDAGKTDIVLYIASHEENGETEDLAAIIALFQKDEAVYLYGCSGNNKRNLMPAYLVQWTAICDAKAFGSKTYDFYGIPPIDDENHPMHGLYLFKTGFGGQEVHRPGSFDVPLSWLYKLYTKAEDFRAWYHKKFLKKIRGR